MTLETKEGARRACWNSRIAPHNLEGFFLNMGDMLVKSGDWSGPGYADAIASSGELSYLFQIAAGAGHHQPIVRPQHVARGG